MPEHPCDEPTLCCTGRQQTCGPCNARRVLALSRDSVASAMVEAVYASMAEHQPTNADFARFCALILQNMVLTSACGVGMARAALMLAEAAAPIAGSAMPAGRRFDA